MLALLAAGQSRRFVNEDKLTALLHGKMLGLHAAETLASVSFDHHVVIVSSAEHACAARWQDLGYKIVVNDRAVDGQSTSVAQAAHEATACHASALCICLADMPFITSLHMVKLSEAFQASGGGKVVASSDKGSAMPPVLFPSSQFATLKDIRGDQGAKRLLKTAHLVPENDGGLLDIDTLEALEIENRKAPRT